MINKFEAIGILACIGLMAVALFLLRVDDATGLLGALDTTTQTATVLVPEGENSQQVLADSLVSSVNNMGDVSKLIIDDVVYGEGNAVEEGDTVLVHYIGTLENGQQFDNSYTRGEPFEFTVGQGQVIQGWEQGLLGMKKGGQRIIVVPSELAYGTQGIGPIPGNATLVFALELVEIK